MENESNKETWYLLLKGRNVYKNKKKKGKRVETCMINHIYCYLLFKTTLVRLLYVFKGICWA